VTVESYAQRPDVPGNVGDSVRPDRSAAEDRATRKEAADLMRTPDFLASRKTLDEKSLNEQFSEYAGIAQELGTAEAALKEEYAEERQDIPSLQPKHLFAFKLLALTTNQVRPDVRVTKRDILVNIKEGEIRNQEELKKYLRKRGLSQSEAQQAYSMAVDRLAAIKNKASQK
jgi:hypothetical protein